MLASGNLAWDADGNIVLNKGLFKGYISTPFTELDLDDMSLVIDIDTGVVTYPVMTLSNQRGAFSLWGPAGSNNPGTVSLPTFASANDADGVELLVVAGNGASHDLYVKPSSGVKIYRGATEVSAVKFTHDYFPLKIKARKNSAGIIHWIILNINDYATTTVGGEVIATSRIL